MKSMVVCTFVLAVASVPVSSRAQQEAGKTPQSASVPAQPAAPDTTQSPPATGAAPVAAGGTAATAGAQTSGSAAANRYVVGPEDSIQVNVWREPSFSGQFPVRPDGMISVALLGDIAAAGRTPMDLASDLTERLRKFITDPVVTVTVLAVNSKRVFMLGEVAKTGPIPMTSDLTPLQAIIMAGGLTPYANRKHIYILRSEGGKQTKIPFNYSKAIKDGNLQGVVLLPGDTIVVP